MNTKLKKWINWLKIIESEIYDLVVTKDIFWQVQEIIKNNKAIQKPSIFYDYLGDTYISYTLIGLRRQIKKDNQSISFVRLLDEIAKNSEILSRDFFRSLYSSPIITKLPDLPDIDFDKYCGSSADHISREMVENDIKKIKDGAIKCEEIADKRIAHRDKRGLKNLLRFGDVDECIDLIDKLYCKYHLIFTAEWTDSLKPTYQNDWKAIFNEAWLIPQED
jgi:hypothetical protein